MKKISFLFVVMALAMFSFVFAAAAQTAELPAIDEAQAEPYLGVWYMEKMCFGEECMDLSSFGLKSTLTLNADNTMTMESEGEEPQVTYWYMEDGTAYNVEEINGEKKTYAMDIDDEGRLTFGTEEMSMHFVRDFAPIPGQGELKADAAAEDFSGEWLLNGIMAGGGVLPASLFGMTGTLTIGESTLSVTIVEETMAEDAAFELKDGKIYTSIETKDEAGNPVTQNIILEYHMDNSVLMIFEGSEQEGAIVFVREADMGK